MHLGVINGAAGLSDTQEALCLPRTFLNSLELDGLAKASPGSWYLAAGGTQGCGVRSASSLYARPPPPRRQENTGSELLFWEQTVKGKQAFHLKK